MKFCLYLTIILIAIALALPALAQEKSPQKQQLKATQIQPRQPQMFQIISRIARGARFESQDAKNVSFTLRPTAAFIQIRF